MSDAKKNDPTRGAPGRTTESSSTSRSQQTTSTDTASRGGTGSANVASGRPKVAVRQSTAKIPRLLKDHNRWILWKYTLLPNRKWTKTPHSPSGHHKIDATNFSNGTSFKTALQALRNNRDKFDGLGFLLGDGIAGIDVDDCIDENGVLDARGRAISETYRGTYAEISPSGTGFKLLVDIGDDPKLAVIGMNTKEIEIYGGRRYFTITGAKLPEHADVIASMPKEFAATAAQRYVNFSKRLAAEPSTDGRPLSSIDSAPIVGASIERVRKLLARLPDQWVVDYWPWLRVGMALHHQFGSAGEALGLWCDWSERCPEKFSGEVCGEKWHSFGRYVGDPITLRTLIDEAKKAKLIDADDDDLSWLDKPDKPEFVLMSARQLMEIEMNRGITSALGYACPVGVVVIAGMGGSGKSTIAATFAAHVSNGQPCPPWERRTAEREPAGVLWLTTEEDRDRVVIPRHEALGGDVDRLFLPTIATKPGDDGRPHAVGFTIDEDLQPMLQQAIDRGTPIRLVVADALPALADWDGRSPNNDTDVKQFLADLADIATRYECCILGVMHFNKKADLPDELRMAGSQAWRESPRLSFVADKAGFIYVNKSNDVPEHGCTFTQEVVKVLYEIEAETPDGKPVPTAARRAVFGAHLLPKGEVLEAMKVAKTAATAAAGEAKRDPEQPTARIAAIAAIVREVFDALDDAVPASTLWNEVHHGYGSMPNGEEKQKVAKLVGIEYRLVDGKRVYVKLPRALASVLPRG